MGWLATYHLAVTVKMSICRFTELKTANRKKWIFDLARDNQKRLIDFIKQYKNALVAYSGGLDSSLVLWASIEALGPGKVLAVTSLSESYATGEKEAARKIADELGLPEKRHRFVSTREMDNENYVKNPADRCYWCKHTLYTELGAIAQKENLAVIFDGTNLSDASDYRPGLKAAREMHVVSPLRETGLTKDDVRGIARENGLSFAEKPASACLASRIPYGTSITPERLRMIDMAETAVREAGFEGFRVRYHHDVARLELKPEDLPRLLGHGIKDLLIKKIKQAGFKYVAVDLEGYRTGSMNEAVGKDKSNDR